MVTRRYLLDTNILIAMFRGEYQIQERLVHEGFDRCVVSDVSLGELYTGAFISGRPHEFRQVEFVRNNFEIISSSRSFVTFGRLRALLSEKGNKIDDLDVYIASSALDNNYILVTNNVKHFSRIPNLEVRDWFEEHSRQITAEKYLSFR